MLGEVFRRAAKRAGLLRAGWKLLSFRSEGDAFAPPTAPHKITNRVTALVPGLSVELFSRTSRISRCGVALRRPAYYQGNGSAGMRLS